MMIRPLLILATLLFAAGGALSAEHLRGPVEATLVRVIDGDTVNVRAKIWLNQTLDISVRLRGIDTPELSAPCASERRLAQKARERLEALLVGANDVTPVTLRHISKGKYAGRVIAYVDNESGVSVGDILLKENLAQPYRGNGAKPDWCRGWQASDLQ